MEKKIPAHWVLHLVVIILLFSVGASLFPSGWIVQDLAIRSRQPHFSYRGSFNANLTTLNPSESLDLGYCSDITIQEWTLTPLAPILLKIRSANNSSLYILPVFNETSQEIFARFEIRLPHSNYILDAIRQANNTYFHCWVSAYPFYPSYPASIYQYICWGIGATMIIIAIALTYRFYAKTKQIFQTA